LFKLEIISKCTIKDLLNYFYLLGNLLNVLVIGYMDKPKLEQLEKMLNFMIQIGVPYYPRYLIKTNMISYDEFFKLKDKLELFDDIKVKMFWGNSQVQRYNFVKYHISFSSDIVDFGCGEGFYIKKLLPQLSKSNKYIAWDADPDELAKIKYFKEKNPEFTNLIIPESEFELFELFKLSNVNNLNPNPNPNPNPNILLSEVFEHIEPIEAIKLLEKIKTKINFKSIIITTPDIGFNKYYSSDGEINSRHHDHKYEYTQEEFTNVIVNIFDSKTYLKNYFQVGDTIESIIKSASNEFIINSNSITQSFVITNI